MSLLSLPGQVAGGVLDPLAKLIKNPFGGGKLSVNPPDYPNGFQIMEIVDGVDQSKTELKLLGNMLPMIPFKFGGAQHMSKEYYAGNSEPSVHVLGAREDDLTIHGKLKDKRYNEDLGGVSYEVMQALEKMRIRGNLLRLTLGGWVRYGFLEKTEFELNKVSDIGYSMTFSIVGFTKPSNNKMIANTKEIPIDVNQDLINQAAAFQANYQAALPSKTLADLLNGYVNDVATAVALVNNFVSTVVTAAQDVEKVAFRAIGLVQNARTSIYRFQRNVWAFKADFNTLKASANAAAQPVNLTHFTDILKIQQTISHSISDSNGLNDMLAQMQTRFSAIAKQTPLARYLVKDGDTLQRIAVKFYGSADSWDRIYDHNKLQTSQLTRGQLLEIPRV